MHRLLEGAALALTSSVMVAAALIVHALAEGLAAGTLLGRAPRRQVVLWLTAMCVSPIVGAAITELWPFPARLEPVLLAVAAGVLGQAARVSLGAAFHQVRLARIVVSSPAAATLIAAAVTTLAVHGAGLDSGRQLPEVAGEAATARATAGPRAWGGGTSQDPAGRRTTPGPAAT